MRGLIEKYLAEMDVPAKYVDSMYSVPSNDVHWITQTEFDSDFQGLIPEVKGWMGARCASLHSEELNYARPFAKTTSIEKTNSSFAGDPAQELKCWMRLKTEISNEAWKKVYAH